MKNTIYWKIFGDIWEFMSKSYPPSPDSAYWADVCARAAKLHEPYTGTEYDTFVKKILFAVCDELERIVK